MNPVLIILLVLHFLNDGVRTVFLSLLPFISKDMHLSFTQIGFISALLGATLAVFSLPAGFLSGKFGGFRILFIGLLLYSIGAGIVGLSFNYAVLVIAYVIAAVAYGSFHIICNVLIAKTSNKTNLARNLSDSSVFGDAGRIALPVVAIFLTSLVGWRDTFFIVAGCGLLVYLLTQWWVPLKNHVDNTAAKKNKQSPKEWFAELPLFLKNKKIVLVIITGMIDNLASNPIFIFLPFLLLARGFSAATLGIFISSFFIGSLVGKFFIGRSLHLLGSARTFMMAEYLMAITLILLTFSYNFFILLGISFLLGTFVRGTGPIVNALYAEIVHEEHYDKVFGISETMTGIGITIAPMIAGVIADRFGVVTFFYVAALFACLATVPIFLLLKSGGMKTMRIAPVQEIE